jgi:hypothetical protein
MTHERRSSIRIRSDRAHSLRPAPTKQPAANVCCRKSRTWTDRAIAHAGRCRGPTLKAHRTSDKSGQFAEAARRGTRAVVCPLEPFAGPSHRGLVSARWGLSYMSGGKRISAACALSSARSLGAASTHDVSKRGVRWTAFSTRSLQRWSRIRRRLLAFKASAVRR